MGFFSDVWGLITGATQKRKWLQEHGTSVEATLMEVSLNTTITVDGRSPYQIIAQWVRANTNEVYIFKSENLWYDPTPYLTTDPLTVLIDTDNPKRYLMDISFLPKKA